MRGAENEKVDSSVQPFEQQEIAFCFCACEMCKFAAFKSIRQEIRMAAIR
jgi:hypothetical protein